MGLEGKILVNRYEIIEKVGNGGMATVYKARDTILNRFVAVKILRDEFTTDQEFIKRFEIEAQSAASITHPNIVSVYDVGSDENLHFIVMELIKGKTLKQIIIQEEGPLPWKWSVNIAIQIASALEVAHKNNIVHRDIKPHNIIITEDGVAKVTDFGIAKAVSNSTITAFGSTIGSVHYFSPEHAKGGITDAKSDLYSLGVVMYEMLTGQLPFDADTPVSVALKHMQEEPVEPIELNDKIPTAVNDIIMKALRKDANLRYASSTAMLSDLKRALKEPDGDFVDKESYEDSPTQKISTIYDQMEEEKNEKTKRNKKKKDNKFIAWVKKHKKFSMFIAIVLVFFLSFGGTWLYGTLTAPKVDIPNLIGVELEQARTEIEEINENTEGITLSIEVSSEEYSDEFAEGYIISQDPEEGTVKEDTTISVVVSKGIETVEVPKVTGMTQQAATEALEELGLEVEVTQSQSNRVESGYVIEQSIESGTEVTTGDTITITVSTGPKQVTVTSVVGKTEEAANTELTNLGLSVTVVYEEDTSKDNGVVLKQSIDAGTSVNEGSSITITVNQVEETKSATIYINVTNIIGGYSTSDDTIEDAEKRVSVELSVGGDIQYSSNTVDRNIGTISTLIQGNGSVRLTLTITDSDGLTEVRNYTINLNSETSYTFNS